MKHESKTIGQIIKDARKAHGMTQMDLSEKVGVSYQQIQKYEKGNDIGVGRLKQIARAVNIPIMVFFPEFVERSAETRAGYGGKALGDDEADLLAQFRRIKSLKSKKAVIELLRTFTKR